MKSDLNHRLHPDQTKIFLDMIYDLGLNQHAMTLEQHDGAVEVLAAGVYIYGPDTGRFAWMVTITYETMDVEMQHIYGPKTQEMQKAVFQAVNADERMAAAYARHKKEYEIREYYI